MLTGRTPVQPAVLPTGAPLLPAALRRLACDTTFSLIVHQHLTAAGAAGTTGAGAVGAGQAGGARGAGEGPARVEPLYVGRSSRTVSGAQFKALVVRDRHCVARGCHRRPSQCQAHHVRHWLDGGATDLDNLVLLCDQHHHDHHDRGHDLQHHNGRWLTQAGWGTDPP